MMHDNARSMATPYMQERSSEAGQKLAYAQLRDLSSFLQKRISEKVDFAWTVACSEDLKHATTDGERSNSWAADVFAAYFQQLWFAATVDEQVSSSLEHSLGM